MPSFLFFIMFVLLALCTTDRHKYFSVVTLEPLWWFIVSCESPTNRLHLLSGFSFLSFEFCALVIVTWIQLLVFPMMFGLCVETTTPEWSTCSNFTRWEVLPNSRTGQRPLGHTCPSGTEDIFSVRPNPAQHSRARTLIQQGWAGWGGLIPVWEFLTSK